MIDVHAEIYMYTSEWTWNLLNLVRVDCDEKVQVLYAEKGITRNALREEAQTYSL